MDHVFLPRGTEYERLPDSLRLREPWATVNLQAASAPLASVPGVDPIPADHEQGPTGRSEELAARVRERIRANHSAEQPAAALRDSIRNTADVDPDRVALADSVRTVTYAQLDDRTDRVAALLHERGVCRGDVVVVALARSVELVEAMIGVWKAGAAFLCVDPAAPASWREGTARRAGARVVVAVSASVVPGLVHLTPESFPTGAPVIDLVRPEPDELAYVIQTSGSTGVPKLVMVHHGGVENLARAFREALPGLGAETRTLQFSAPTFDAIVLDLVLSLWQGGQLEVLDATTEVLDLPDVLKRRRITHVILPAVVVRTLEPTAFPDLRVLVSAGEACKPETAKAWAPHVRFFNAYGPAEASVCTTIHQVDPTALVEDTVPIGQALRNCHVVIADDALTPVPDGGEGEICIGGVGVGLGYLDQDDETALRFVPDPFSSVPGARLYRSGDRGRMRPDGTVEFLGRRDHQVKVRGVRVELSEVERALVELPTVSDAVATVEQNPDGDLRLLGHVRLADGVRTDSRAVLAEVGERVAKHLVPSVLVIVDEWPLTSSGKIDRARLPKPAPLSSAPFEAPRTPVEEILAGIAAGLLKLDRIGIHDNFFEMGGHSLLATQFIARTYDALGKEPSLSAVLNGATVAEISDLLQATEDHDTTPLPGARGTGPRTPSHAQQRIWLMQEVLPESLAYNAQLVLRLSGPLDRASLCASLTAMVERHEAIRSRFFEVNGEPRCEVVDPWEVDLPVLDLSGSRSEEQDRRFGAAVTDFVQAPFAIDRDRLVRWLLIRTAEDDHTLVYVEHHTVHDGWSTNVFVNDLLAGYVDHQRFGEVRRPPLTLQYYDYADWQHRWCASPAADRQREFWRRELAGATGVLELPGRPRTETRRFRGAAPRLEIDAELARGLEALSGRTGGTLFMTLLASFFALLHRYSGSRDLLTCSGIANRRWQGTEDLLGMFVNTVVFRGKVPDDDFTFSDLLAQVRQTALGVYDNQELPFEMVLEEARTTRVAGVNPLVQTMFSFHDSPHRELDSLPLDVVGIEALSNGSAKFDLNIIVIPHHNLPGHISRQPGNVVTLPASSGPLLPSPRSALDGITLSWEYDTDRFDESFITGMLEAYLGILHAVVADPRCPVSRLPLLTPRGRDELLALGSGPTGVVESANLSTLIARQVIRAPEAAAVVFGDTTLSYAEVSRRADGLAGRLVGNGIGRDDVVALCLPRSPELVVAFLAVLRTGAGFVALDPDHPTARSSWLLTDSGAAVVVTTAALAHVVPEAVPLPIVLVDDVDREDLPRPATGHEDPHGLAYLCYTSGSTGVPKGVQVEHHSVVAKLTNMRYFDLAPGKSVLHLAPPALDVAVMETLGALAHGATIHVPAAGWNLRELADYLLDHRITHVWLIAPLLHQLATEVPEALDRTEQVLTGADVVSPVVVRRLLERGVREVVNGYGPTEATMFSSAFHATPAGDVAGGKVSIGTPVPEVTISVVDDIGEPVPRGVVGEILISGAGVARGYLDRPEQTAHSFVRSGEGYAYRTGDMARWSEDGTLEFFGRRDSQVKIRGYRVELGEVGAALTSLPLVQDALAMTVPEDGDHRLVAYVVPAHGQVFTGEDVRSALRATVPEQLVPSVVVVVRAWPLTAGGKVDRARLPAPRAGRSSAPVAPRTEVERTLVRLAAELLRVADLGVEDDFFALGGHSLLATKFLARIRAEMGKDIGLDTFFARPTVAGLAELLPRLPTVPSLRGLVKQPRRGTTG